MNITNTQLFTLNTYLKIDKYLNNYLNPLNSKEIQKENAQKLKNTLMSLKDSALSKYTEIYTKETSSPKNLYNIYSLSQIQEFKRTLKKQLEQYNNMTMTFEEPSNEPYDLTTFLENHQID